ncbi:hypothetical protein AXG93_2024s1040 [Marchantia polymorpha subsp. ruderalis]|uniref:Uncharacterized protein n=1 Tax=Marchantia polymorpha subsp. ruderalis TaxID=1480154 RepID=A0A176VKZ5_MARPO|nr:hypothetical protein AXG93_2024s1040 [Marchantia polymorpha subsp. ruderalis]
MGTRQDSPAGQASWACHNHNPPKRYTSRHLSNSSPIWPHLLVHCCSTVIIDQLTLRNAHAPATVRCRGVVFLMMADAGCDVETEGRKGVAMGSESTPVLGRNDGRASEPACLSACLPACQSYGRERRIGGCRQNRVIQFHDLRICSALQYTV